MMSAANAIAAMAGAVEIGVGTAVLVMPCRCLIQKSSCQNPVAGKTMAGGVAATPVLKMRSPSRNANVLLRASDRADGTMMLAYIASNHRPSRQVKPELRHTSRRVIPERTAKGNRHRVSVLPRVS